MFILSFPNGSGLKYLLLILLLVRLYSTMENLHLNKNDCKVTFMQLAYKHKWVQFYTVEASLEMFKDRIWPLRLVLTNLA